MTSLFKPAPNMTSGPTFCWWCNRKLSTNFGRKLHFATLVAENDSGKMFRVHMKCVKEATTLNRDMSVLPPANGQPVTA